jgi:hypothetical protein
LDRLGLRSIDESFLQPFLAGVVLDRDLSATSARFAALLWRSFARGRVGVPELGMGEIPRQLAHRLPDGVVRYNKGVARLVAGPPPGRCFVDLDDGERVGARAVVVATDPVGAERLIPGAGMDPSAMRGVTTYWHHAPDPPLDEPLLVLDGEHRLVANSVVVSNASPAYLQGHPGAMIATSVLGCQQSASTERAVRDRLAVLYGVSTRSWDLVAVHAISRALPAFPPGTPLCKPVRFGAGRYVCGDHRDTPSIQGALVSGRRTADAVAADLAAGRPSRVG